MRPWAPLAVAVVAIVLVIVFAPAHAYLAAWLFLIGLTTGALPLVIVLEWYAIAGPLVDLSRALVRAIPFAALLFIPVLVRLHATYDWTGSTRPSAPFGRDWLTPGFFIARSVIYLVIWSLLSVVFAGERSAAKRGLAQPLGLAVHVVVGTLAALDWTLSVDPRFHSSVIGLLVVFGEAASAVALVVLIVGGSRPARFALLITGGVWFYLQFIQFLVTWSGNLLDGATWYAARDANGGRALEWFWAIAGFPLPVLLLSIGRAVATRFAATLMLLAQAVSAVWFVAPGNDASAILATLALGIAAICCVPLLGRSLNRRRVTHERLA